MNLNPIESEIKEILSLLWAEAEEGYLALCSIKPGDIKSEFSDLSKENAIDMAVQKAKSTVINEFNAAATLIPPSSHPAFFTFPSVIASSGQTSWQQKQRMHFE